MRHKKYLTFIFFTLLLLSIYLFFKGEKKNENDLRIPKFSFTTIDNQLFTNTDLKDISERLIVVRFSTDCSNCENMAKSLAENYKKFTETTLIMITKSDSASTAKFYLKFHLNKLSKMQILLDKEPHDSMSAFKSYLIPTFFVFKQGKQINRIVGDVKIDSLLID